jgi:Tfp pilus assembly protein PilN
MRLLSEGILGNLPSKILLEGMPKEKSEVLLKELTAGFPKDTISATHEAPPASLPTSLLDLPPAGARRDRLRKRRTERLLSVGSATALLYLLLLAWGSGDLLIRQSALKRIRRESALMDAPAQQAKIESDRWNALRAAIDPSTYPLDLLAAVAAPTEGGKVRLTNFNMEQGRLQISGEATDVTQAYAFIEQLKKNPLLQEYDWTAGQPQLAGKNIVKFDMEGTRAGTSLIAP